MKKLTFLSLLLALSSAAMAVPSPACPTGNCNTPPTALPINYGVYYLLIAGIILGIVAIKKYKSFNATV